MLDLIFNLLVAIWMISISINLLQIKKDLDLLRIVCRGTQLTVTQINKRNEVDIPDFMKKKWKGE